MLNKPSDEFSRKSEIYHFFDYYGFHIRAFPEKQITVPVRLHNNEAKDFTVKYSKDIPEEEFRSHWRDIAKQVQDFIDPDRTYKPSVRYIHCASD